MSEELFDQPERYEAMLQLGIRLSGESRTFFIEGRLGELVRALPPGVHPRRILDFGCGTGETTARLAALYPGARVTGTDPASAALVAARRNFPSPALEFTSPDEIGVDAGFDLVYSNGVFHHIAPAERASAVDWIRVRLAPGGRFALFENNAWNPGAHWVMRRIPFDCDTVMLSPRGARALLAERGFEIDGGTRSLFWFPRALAFLRPLERRLAAIPLGAQFLLIGRTPDRSAP